MKTHKNLLKNIKNSKWYDRCGLWIVYFFAASTLVKASFANMAISLLMIWWILDIQRNIIVWKKTPVFWLSLLFTIFIIVRLILNIFSIEGGDGFFSTAEKVVKSGFLFSLPIATIVGRWERKRKVILIIWIAGIFIHPFIHFDHWYTENIFEQLITNEDRLSFAYSATNFGLWCVLTLIPLLFKPLRPSILKKSSNRLCIYVFMWLIALITIILFLILSKTVGALLILGLLPFVMLFDLTMKKKFINGILLFISLFATFLLLLQIQYFNDRINDKIETLHNIRNGFHEKVKNTPTEKRIRMYSHFYRKFKEKPFTGFGLDSSKELIKDIQLHEPHFHNSFFEILIQIGIIGFILYFGFWFIVLHALWKTLRKDHYDPWPLLLITELAAFAFFALTHHPLGSQYGPFVLALFAGFSLSNFYRKDHKQQNMMTLQAHVTS